jgi:hypothetical protein
MRSKQEANRDGIVPGKVVKESASRGSAGTPDRWRRMEPQQTVVSETQEKRVMGFEPTTTTLATWCSTN